MVEHKKKKKKKKGVTHRFQTEIEEEHTNFSWWKRRWLSVVFKRTRLLWDSAQDTQHPRNESINKKSTSSALNFHVVCMTQLSSSLISFIFPFHFFLSQSQSEDRRCDKSCRFRRQELKRPDDVTNFNSSCSVGTNFYDMICPIHYAMTNLNRTSPSTEKFFCWRPIGFLLPLLKNSLFSPIPSALFLFISLSLLVAFSWNWFIVLKRKISLIMHLLKINCQTVVMSIRKSWAGSSKGEEIRCRFGGTSSNSKRNSSWWICLCISIFNVLALLLWIWS